MNHRGIGDRGSSMPRRQRHTGGRGGTCGRGFLAKRRKDDSNHWIDVFEQSSPKLVEVPQQFVLSHLGLPGVIPSIECSLIKAAKVLQGRCHGSSKDDDAEEAEENALGVGISDVA